MQYVIIRERSFSSITFYEILFTWKDECLQLNQNVERFKERILSKQYIPECNVEIIKVISQPFLCDEVSQHKIIHTNGIWLVANDCIAKGENVYEGIPAKAQFYDVEICEKDCDLIKKLFNKLNISMHYPLSLYHGTKNSLRKEIVKEGLKESFGMLGDAIYVGTFWKACRFASFDKTYHHQDGCIFKILAFVKEIQNYPFEHWKCDCCSSEISDHKSIWKLIHDGAHVNIGKERGQLKNEEWAVKEHLQFITHVAECEKYEYTPYKRNIKII